MKQHRLLIYPKDVCLITGKGERHAQKLLRTMHEALQKEEHQGVTIIEFADYMGLDADEVKAVCLAKPKISSG
ncbi:hypothetical protein H8S90_13910 [Olivibacter sp. SDN3]|uniref:hypothetical protein n=1 Tax=Olivibacter sp. SDN3 TaxID=2764720 RepID=UPI0016517D11|nr:hypothetical protein [Olivibacter sp. SDN3]QNL47914.1 hypothetical protein H8S90_13910 [Olivibacter sp. SDN3]